MKRIITLCAVLSVSLAPAVFAHCGSCDHKKGEAVTSGTNEKKTGCGSKEGCGKKEGKKDEGKKQ